MYIYCVFVAIRVDFINVLRSVKIRGVIAKYEGLVNGSSSKLGKLDVANQLQDTRKLTLMKA